MRCRWLFALAVFVTGASHPRLAQAHEVTAVKAAGTVEFKVDDKVVAKYHVAESVAKPYLWPVLAPDGTPVTRTWPIQKGAPGDMTTDHPHQKSVWFCHGEVVPEGIDLKGRKFIDFWAESGGNGKVIGKIVCVKVGEPKQVDGHHVAVTTWNEWRTDDGVKVLDEERTVHFRTLPQGRLFAFECKLTASVCPVVFDDTKEGSFGVRVHDALRTQLPTGGTVTAADGTTVKSPTKGTLSVWGKPADWHDYSGTVDGKAVGVAVFDHPQNPYRANWHTRDYGLLAANPFGRERSGFPSQKGKTDVVRLEKGKSLTFRYAVYAHSGDAKAGKVAEAYEVFKK